MGKMVATFEPTQVDLFAEIGADKFFFSDIPANISQSIQDNPITPVITRDYLANLLTERQAYLDEINQLRGNLEKIGIGVEAPDKVTAEIGFLIPRDLFQNQFDEFIEHLELINRIIREFSETATGSAQKINVRQISTSDPIIFFGLDAQTIAMIAGAVTWALHTWLQAEQIKKVRNEASKITVFKNSDLKVFDDKIKKTIEAETEKKVEELLAIAKDKASRTTNEKRTHLTWTLEALLALVERGLKVEVRLLLPPPPEDAEEGQKTKVPSEFKQVEEIIPQLVFPHMEGEPILKLPSRKAPTKAPAEAPAEEPAAPPVEVPAEEPKRELPKTKLEELMEAYAQGVTSYKYDYKQDKWLIRGDKTRIMLGSAIKLTNVDLDGNHYSLFYIDNVYLVDQKATGYCEGTHSKYGRQCSSLEIRDIPYTLNYADYKDKTPADWLFEFYDKKPKIIEEGKYYVKGRQATVIIWEEDGVETKMYFDEKLGMPMRIEIGADPSKEIYDYGNLAANTVRDVDVIHRSYKDIPTEEVFYSTLP